MMSRNIKLALCITLFVLMALSLGFALLMSLAAVLASLGILADVGYAENRAMAREAFTYAMIAYGVGLVLLAGALLALRAVRR